MNNIIKEIFSAMIAVVLLALLILNQPLCNAATNSINGGGRQQFYVSGATDSSNDVQIGLPNFTIGMKEQEIDKVIADMGYPVLKREPSSREFSITNIAKGNEVIVFLSFNYFGLYLAQFRTESQVQLQEWNELLGNNFGFQIKGGRAYCAGRNIYAHTFNESPSGGGLTFQYIVKGKNECEGFSNRSEFPAIAFSANEIAPTRTSVNVNPTKAVKAEIPFLFDEPDSNISPLLSPNDRLFIVRKRMKAATLRYQEALAPIVASRSNDVNGLSPRFVIERFMTKYMNASLPSELAGRAYYFKAIADQGYIQDEHDPRIPSSVESFEKCAEILRNRNCGLIYNYLMVRLGKQRNESLVANTKPLSGNEISEIKKAINMVYDYVIKREPVKSFNRADIACLKVETNDVTRSSTTNNCTKSYRNFNGIDMCLEYEQKTQNNTYVYTRNTCGHKVAFSAKCRLQDGIWRHVESVEPGGVTDRAIGEIAGKPGCSFEGTFKLFD